jgi:hypothetical protein
VYTLRRWPHGGKCHTHAQNERTALICAAEKGHTECARLLLDAGADMNAKEYVRFGRFHYLSAFFHNMI